MKKNKFTITLIFLLLAIALIRYWKNNQSPQPTIPKPTITVFYPPSQTITIPTKGSVLVDWVEDERVLVRRIDMIKAKTVKFLFFNPQTEIHEEREYTVSVTEECTDGFELERGSKINSNLYSFIMTCDHHDYLRDERIISLDLATGETKVLFIAPFIATRELAFNPTLSRVVQGGPSDGVFNALYLGTRASFDPLFPKGYRAGYPAWSADGKHFVWGGNKLEANPRDKSSIFGGGAHLAAAINEPWTLYSISATNGHGTVESQLYDAVEGQEFFPEVLLEKIYYLRTIKLNPTKENVVAFVGKIQALYGIWVYDWTIPQLSFVWSGVVSYDWSPDGNKIVLVEELENGSTDNKTLNLVFLDVAEIFSSLNHPTD